MPMYAYKALQSDGTQVSGREEAADEVQLNLALQARQIYVLEAEPELDSEVRRFKGKVRRQDIIDFTEQLGIVSRAGIPLLAGLEEIADETVNPGLKRVLLDMIERITQGTQLSQAMAAYPQVFDEAYLAAVKAGEAGGGLEQVLEDIAQQMIYGLDTRKQITSSLIQPAFLLVAVVLLIVMVITVLVPEVTKIFSRTGAELPTPTQILVDLSDIMRNHWAFVIAGLVGFFITMKLAVRHPKVALIYDQVKLGLPVAGDVMHLFAVSRFVGIFRLLYEAGVTVDRSLEIGSKVTGNRVIDKGVAAMRRTVLEGKPLAEGARSAGVFPSLVVRMLRIGEQSGQVPEALRKVSLFYDKEIPRALKRIITVLQPMITFVSAIVVGFVVVAAFLPIMKLISGAKG